MLQSQLTNKKMRQGSSDSVMRLRTNNPPSIILLMWADEPLTRSHHIEKKKRKIFVGLPHRKPPVKGKPTNITLINEFKLYFIFFF